MKINFKNILVIVVITLGSSLLFNKTEGMIRFENQTGIKDKELFIELKIPSRPRINHPYTKHFNVARFGVPSDKWSIKIGTLSVPEQAEILGPTVNTTYIIKVETTQGTKKLIITPKFNE